MHITESKYLGTVSEIYYYKNIISIVKHVSYGTIKVLLLFCYILINLKE